MKPYILYHGNCPDGTGAALAAFKEFGEGAVYIPVNYGKPPPDMENGSPVFILDFSYPRQTLIALRDHHPDLKVIDHHATAERDLEGLEFCTFDMNKSGAVLAWEHFHPSIPVPLFIQYLQDRDLWKFELPESREVSAAIGSYPLDFRTWINWVHEWDIIDHLAAEGATCLRLKNQQVDIMARNHAWGYLAKNGTSIDFEIKRLSITPSGFTEMPVANATVFFSEVGERLLELNQDCPCAAYYFDRNDGNRQWGLRSRKDFDCSVIAKAFGGGGHKQASGFTQPL